MFSVSVANRDILFIVDAFVESFYLSKCNHTMDRSVFFYPDPSILPNHYHIKNTLLLTPYFPQAIMIISFVPVFFLLITLSRFIVSFSSTPY